MRILICSTGKERIALDCKEIREILPFVGLKSAMNVSPFIAGLLDYHGTLIPVIDLSRLLHGRESCSRFSTRILLANFNSKVVGVIAENAADITSIRESDIQKPLNSLDSDESISIICRENEKIQLLSIAQLLKQVDPAQIFEAGGVAP